LQITEVSAFQKVVSAPVDPTRTFTDVSCKEKAVPYRESVQILAEPDKVASYVNMDAVL